MDLVINFIFKYIFQVKIFLVKWQLKYNFIIIHLRAQKRKIYAFQQDISKLAAYLQNLHINKDVITPIDTSRNESET